MKYEFNNRKNALGFADKCHKAHMVILGDNVKFWVVTMAEGSKLLRQGYQVA